MQEIIPRKTIKIHTCFYLEIRACLRISMEVQNQKFFQRLKQPRHLFNKKRRVFGVYVSLAIKAWNKYCFTLKSCLESQ